MIQYICKYQNHHSYFHLFENNLIELLQRKIELVDLFNSDVLYPSFEYEGWPQSHTCAHKHLAPYNGSFFNLRYEYARIFPALKHQEI
jgi:hypothetical protein